jgi:hypothetical protein
MEQRSPNADRADGEAAAAKYPYRIEDTGEGAWTLFSNEPTRTAAGVPSNHGRTVEVFVGETAKEVAETTCRILSEEVTRTAERFKDLFSLSEYRTKMPEDVTTSKTIKARDLRPGYSVKAEGAAAWSTIGRVDELAAGGIVANLDWGRITYAPDEDVEIEAVSLI